MGACLDEKLCEVVEVLSLFLAYNHELGALTARELCLRKTVMM